MKILVTGGSGYLGTHVVHFFGAQDFSRRSDLDILSPADAAVVADYDVVIHLAAFLSQDPTEADQCFRTNAEGTANVLRHMSPNSVFIYASTKDVYGSFAGEYDEVPETCCTDYCGQKALAWSKLVGERYVEYYAAERGFRACIFRLSTVYARPSEGNEYGFVTNYVESIKRGWPIRLPSGGQPIRDILHVNDFCRACRAFVDSSQTGGLYNLGGGKANAASLREIIDRIAEMIQCTAVIDIESVPPAPVPLHYVSDLSRISAELDWKPAIGIEEGLRSLI
ncbi:MAG: NAD-dependent epimerase/dehydratase family protein [Pyrinomonadaceae bacterium]